MDLVLEYMKKHDIPITRENYISVNWMGDYNPDEPLPAELEASLPVNLRMEPKPEPTEGKTEAGLNSLGS